ncbi:GNAT family N-acetyltransferase [Virgibacillus flavescens]|uniref:GNAT family N-acetyltransferase n=1 Tax=Virgibacillus flavescens TaxID=1611422 RepID=UPI003D32BC49
MIKIIGDKVELTEASSKDIDELYFWKFEEEQQEAKKWNGPYISEEKQSKEDYRKSFKQELDIDEGVPATLVIKTNGELIGYVSSYWVDKNTNWLETGIVIYNSAFWSGGYGSEAYKRWIDFLFEKTDLHRLGMSTWSGNIRMVKVAEKIGMKEEARIRNARMVEGNYFDAIKMGILREEWV